jgi:ribonucleoside-diphosphate reductase alpha chain
MVQHFQNSIKNIQKLHLLEKCVHIKKVSTLEQLRQILAALQSISHPWLIWKDSINLRALNNNTGTVHMFNLYAEICLPQDRENVAVRNLALLNLAAHVSNKEIPEAVKLYKENRAIGLRVMRFLDTIEQLGMPYNSEHA